MATVSKKDPGNTGFGGLPVTTIMPAGSRIWSALPSGWLGVLLQAANDLQVAEPRCLRFAFAFTSLAPSKSTPVNGNFTSPAPQAAGPLATCIAKVPCTSMMSMIHARYLFVAVSNKIDVLASKALLKFSSDNPESKRCGKVICTFTGD